MKAEVTKIQSYIKKCSNLLTFHQGVPELKSGITIYMVLNWVIKKCFNDTVTTSFIVWILWSWPCSYIWEDREPHISFYGLVDVDNLPKSRLNRDTMRSKELQDTKGDTLKRKGDTNQEEELKLKKEYTSLMIDQANETSRMKKQELEANKLEFVLKEKDSAVAEIESIMRNMERCQGMIDSCKPDDLNRILFYNDQWDRSRVAIDKVRQKIEMLDKKLLTLQKEDENAEEDN